MPKIRDLGIKVIPETMQPPEVGGGGGGKPGPECKFTIVVLCDGGSNTVCGGCLTTLTCCPGSCDATSTFPKDYEWSREAIDKLKGHLRDRIAKLEEYEKSYGSKKPSKGGKKSSRKK